MSVQPLSLEQIKKNRKPIRNVNLELESNLNLLERFAVWITDHVGSMGFFLLIFGWTIVWLIWNTYAPVEYRFDKFPAFVLWLFISNTLQLFLMPLIMVGQNLQARHAEARTEAEYEIGVKSEREIEAILEHLEYQSDLILKLSERLEK